MTVPAARDRLVCFGVVRLGLLVLAAASLALPLSGCGRKGAPHAPGPADRIIYPKLYPSQ